MATVHRINAACTEVISNDECHVLLIYTSISNDIVRHTVETQQEEFLFSDPKFKIALAWASERVEDMACTATPRMMDSLSHQPASAWMRTMDHVKISNA